MLANQSEGLHIPRAEINFVYMIYNIKVRTILTLKFHNLSQPATAEMRSSLFIRAVRAPSISPCKRFTS